MKHLVPLTLSLVLLLLAGCLPLGTSNRPTEPAPSTPTAAADGGPYWHPASAEIGPADALAYYGALKTLSVDELSHEQQRLEAAIAEAGSPLPHLQRLLLACLPEQRLVDGDQARQSLAQARQDAALHRRLAPLFVLLDDQLVARQTPAQAQGKESGQGNQALRLCRQKAKAQAAELATCQGEMAKSQGEVTACRDEREELAGKLQKLQEIERGLRDRERR